MGKHITTDVRDGVTVVTARDGLFDVLPETDESGTLAAEVIAEFGSAVAAAGAVVLDLRRAGVVLFSEPGSPCTSGWLQA